MNSKTLKLSGSLFFDNKNIPHKKNYPYYKKNISH